MADLKHELTEQEADLYDRQIRLWGLESQKKLRVADVLLINVRSLGAEIAKNILLSGIRSLTFLDDGKVTEDDCAYNFLLPRSSLGTNISEAVIERAKNLNPMVEIIGDPTSVNDKPDAFYKKFTLVIATQLSLKQLIHINQVCRRHGVQFLCGDVFGMFGYIFSDLQEHEFTQNVKQLVPAKRKLDGRASKMEEVIVRVIEKIKYIPLEDAINLDWLSGDQKKINKISPGYCLTLALLKFRDEFQRNLDMKEKDADVDKLKNIRQELFKQLKADCDTMADSEFDVLFGEVVPVCAIVGGVLAQEVIKAVSHNGSPINNMFFFDPKTLSGKIENVGI